MRGHVVARETDAVDALMIMDGEIRKSFVSAGEGAAPDEVRGEHAVATLAWHIVDAVSSKEQPAREETTPPSYLGD
ncbi:MAG: hypothetical protein OXH38_13315 [Chloroflexi bacterium]|nr:hypothetical protein [Chloroflexota bacterium]